ncbi:(+)-epi-alpha-bisabolol synthase [Phtheirospermum japonicum]|uniref:(+)-epi-alpha-bisabolol synthase n=1 Tax=Phtheirospermum japonicum TaxID=374723 RepID=A0A830BEI2_9LAMI|nr:(+)-epi-alpha-bisabolol synthase [Phtheirospermum japonicum]
MVFMERTNDLFDQIEVVDLLQRLGTFYHFTDYIDRILGSLDILADGHGQNIDSNLYATVLSFRLLRQHGYKIPTAVDFQRLICRPVDRLTFLSIDRLSSRSTSFPVDRLPVDRLKSSRSTRLQILKKKPVNRAEGESILEEAKEFAAHHLKQKLKQNINKNLADEIEHALEVLFHYRMLRLESKWFIETYEKRPDMNPIMLELAKLDFNIVPAMYQDELKELSRWHTKTRLSEKMTFARDRLVECFLWTIGFTFKPCFRYCRIMSVKLGVLVTIIDDVYDVYATLDELKLFTDIVERWDINAIEQLLEYMKICFLSLFSTVNEMAYDVLIDNGFNIILQAGFVMWAELCKKYMLEAQWYYSEYKPSLNEFLSNAWVSITGLCL